MQYSNSSRWTMMMLIGALFYFCINSLCIAQIREDSNKIPIINDSIHVLQRATFEHIEKYLEDVANKQHVFVTIFIIADNSGDSLVTIAHDSITKFERDYPQIKAKKRRATLFVNMLTNESSVILSEDFPNRSELMVSINNIHREIISANLVNQRIDKAMWEGIVALTMALEDFSQPAKLILTIQEIDNWLQEHHLFSLGSLWFLTKWIMSLLVGAYLFRWLKRLFYCPHWEETLDHDLLATLPDNLSLHDMTSIMIALKKDEAACE